MTVFVVYGDEPLTNDQLSARTEAHLELVWPAWKRERATRTDPTVFNAYMATVATDTDTNRLHNTFNAQLKDFRKATERLTQVQLSAGRAAYSEQIPTGETVWNDTTMVMEPVTQTVDHPAIDPLPALVNGWDNTDPMNPVSVPVPNPQIVKDDAERAEAQAVVTATPAAVKAF